MDIHVELRWVVSELKGPEVSVKKTLQFREVCENAFVDRGGTLVRRNSEWEDVPEVDEKDA